MQIRAKFHLPKAQLNPTDEIYRIYTGRGSVIRYLYSGDI